MKTIKILILIFLKTFFFETSSFSNTDTKILIKIEKELITNFDVKSKILGTLILANKDVNQKNIDSLKKSSLEALIQYKLKKIELEKYNLKKNEKQLNSYLNSISSNNIDNLKVLFNKYNADFEAFVDEIDVEFKWNSFIYNRFSNKINIDQTDIEKEIKNKIINQKNLISYNISEIEILSNNDASDESKILQVQREITNFGFENAVAKFSISSTSSNKGKIGWINSSSLSKNFLNILNKMKIGDISEPIKKQNKIIFLKINDKKTTTVSKSNIESLKVELINKKKNELFELYSNSYLSKLRNSKLIEYYK